MAISVYTYPYKRRDFQKLFMRIDIIDNIADPVSFGMSEGKPQDFPESSLYLPLPLGLLRENHVLEYQPTEFGITGELVKQNYEAVKNSLLGVFGAGENNSNIDNGLLNTLENVADVASDTFKTAIDKTIADASLLAIPTLLQANGLSRRANYSLLFNGIDQVREFTLEWSLFPKNYDDATAIETIIKVVQKAAMPEIKNKGFLDSTIDAFSNIIEDKDKNSDVYAANPAKPTGLYSTTYLIPKKIRIKLFERFTKDNVGNIEETDIREITHLMNFPHENVISSIIVEHSESDNMLPPFVKYNNGGVSEFFHTVYKLRITLSDLQVTTRENVNSPY